MRILFFALSFFCALALSAHTILIENMQFNPGEMSLDTTHKITWTNKDLVPHKITAVDKSFNSPSIEPGKSWSYQPKKKGTFKYFCSFHPTMLGSFTVTKP